MSSDDASYGAPCRRQRGHHCVIGTGDTALSGHLTVLGACSGRATPAVRERGGRQELPVGHRSGLRPRANDCPAMCPTSRGVASPDGGGEAGRTENERGGDLLEVP